MIRKSFLCGLLAWVSLCLAPPSSARELTFEERVRAQEALERVVYAHQIGATEPFERAVPRTVLEAKVRKSLGQSLALERRWNRPITRDALDAELARIERGTRMNDRLVEMFQALGSDLVLMEECVVRAELADRWARESFAVDPLIHESSWRQVRKLRERLLQGTIDPRSPAPERTEAEVVRDERGEAENLLPDGAPPSASTGRLVVPADRFHEWRRAAPARVGEVGPVRDEHGSLSFQVLLDDAEGRFRTAVYTVAKRRWDEWWPSVSGAFDPQGLRSFASDEPSGSSSRPRDVEDRLLEPLRRHVSKSAPAGPILPNGSSAAGQGSWDAGSTVYEVTRRYDYSFVWTGAEVLVWGGRDNDYNVMDSGARYDPVLDSWSFISSHGAPAARYRHSAVWTGSAMIVWGGNAGGIQLGTGGRYDPSTDTWTPVSISGPEGREKHVAVWTGTEMIVWGGYRSDLIGDARYLNSGGIYDPSTDTWRETILGGSPSGRRGHTGVWTGSALVVWGGDATVNNVFTTFDDGGRYDPVANHWTPTSLEGAASPRSDHSAVWTGSRMLVWGGYGDSSGGDTAGYDPATDTWSPISGDGAPHPSGDDAVVWTGSAMLVWGGPAINSGGRYDPSSDSWTPLPTAGAPASLYHPASVWTGTVMIVFGGDNVTPFMSGSRYDPATESWSPTSTGYGPSDRYLHTAVWTGSVMIVWGGIGGPFGGAPDVGWSYDPALDAWTPLSTTNALVRGGHCAHWTGTEMLVWGGSGVSTAGERYNPSSDVVTPMTVSGAPEERLNFVSVWTGTEMIVWGGGVSRGGPTLTTWLNTGARYNPLKNTWKKVSKVKAPAARQFATAVWTGTRMLVWGGMNGTNGTSRLNTGALYDPRKNVWKPTKTVNAPPGRAIHVAAWTGSRMLVWGGLGADNAILMDGASYDPVTKLWSPIASGVVPTYGWGWPLWTGTRMILFGGSSDYHLAGALYDPTSDIWTPTETSAAPPARTYFAAVWTGEQAIVWGGLTTFDHLRSGGRFTPPPVP